MAAKKKDSEKDYKKEGDFQEKSYEKDCKKEKSSFEEVKKEGCKKQASTSTIAKVARENY